MTAIILPAIMDRVSLAQLASEMTDCCDRREPLVVNGAKVTRIGLAGLQLLASAAITARDRDVSFEISEPSDELVGASALSGLTKMFGLSAREDACHDQ